MATKEELESGIAQLFEFYVEYIRTHDAGAQAKVFSQMEALFARLGLAPERLSAIFPDDLIAKLTRSPRKQLDAVKPIERTAVKHSINSDLRGYEREFDVRLTREAREFLRIPLIETFDRTRGNLNLNEVSSSLNLIMRDLGQTKPELPIEGEGKERSSIAVIRSFSINFCRIPPFCNRRTREDERGRE